MSRKIVFTGRIDFHGAVGSDNYAGRTILRSTCAYCNHKSSFDQVGNGKHNSDEDLMIAVSCNGCGSISVVNTDEKIMIPSLPPDRVSELPEEIDKWYSEALACMEAGAPSGAATLFRKVIHALAIHYEIAEIDDNKQIYQMVKDLHQEGHINEKLRQSLLATKDIGNDGAHINDNEPDMQQIEALKSLVDATLRSTVIADRNIQFARQKHPNEYTEN